MIREGGRQGDEPTSSSNKLVTSVQDLVGSFGKALSDSWLESGLEVMKFAGLLAPEAPVEEGSRVCVAPFRPSTGDPVCASVGKPGVSCAFCLDASMVSPL